MAVKARKGELPGWEYTKLEREDAIAAGVVDASQDAQTRLLIPDDEYRILYEGADADDGTIRIDTFKLTEVEVPDMVLRVRAWDLASSEGGDFTVGAKIAANSSGYWIEDIVRERHDAHEVVDLVARTAVADGPSVEHVFEEERGSSGQLVTEFMRRTLDQIPLAGSVWPAPVEQNKMVRAWPFVAQTGAGRVHLAPGFSHAEAMVELEEWPDSRNDDVVDAIAHGINHLTPLVEGAVGSGWTPGQVAS